MSIASIVTDLSFGDAGKGTTVDYLARRAQSVVVRYNGGPQAAHNVLAPDGRHHTFAQFGSGSFVPGTQTHLSRFMLINPLNMELEARHLIDLGEHDIWERLSVDGRAMIITPWHIALNRIFEEQRGGGRHGSCAQGIGETMRQSLEKPELTFRVDNVGVGAAAKLDRLRRYLLWYVEQTIRPVNQVGPDWDLLRDETIPTDLAHRYDGWAQKVMIVDGSYLGELARANEQLVFEGAQGVLLDEWFGFHPYTTWSTTTSANALRLLDEIGHAGDVRRLGILRAYTTRHGPGPFVTEDSALAMSLPELHNGVGKWQGAFRVGHLDLVAHEYALRVNGGVDQLVVTGLDRQDTWRYCKQYEPKFLADNQWSRHFEPNGEQIMANERHNLDFQASLTKTLLGCRPVYSPRNTVKNGGLITTIEEHLDVPVGILSYGPSAADKHALVTC